MSPTPQPDEVSVYTEWAIKISGLFLSFVGGIVAATWAVASKVRGFEDRLGTVEKAQTKCQSEVLAGLVGKLDSLPDRIDEKIEAKFVRVHSRIDELWKDRNGNEHTS